MSSQNVKTEQGLEARGSIAEGFRISMSIALGSGILGIAYGAAIQTTGAPLWSVLLSSTFIFAGSAQFAVLSFVENGAGLVTVFAVAFLVSLRLLLMSGYIGLQFIKLPVWKKILAIPFICDGSWSAVVLSSRPIVARYLVFCVSGAWILINWIVGILVGYLAATHLPDFVRDSAGTAGTIFLMLLLMLISNQAQDNKKHWIIAAITGCVASLVMPQMGAFFVGILGGTASILFDLRKADDYAAD